MGGKEKEGGMMRKERWMKRSRIRREGRKEEGRNK